MFVQTPACTKVLIFSYLFLKESVEYFLFFSNQPMGFRSSAADESKHAVKTRFVSL